MNVIILQARKPIRLVGGYFLAVTRFLPFIDQVMVCI